MGGGGQRLIYLELLSNYESLSLRLSRIQTCYTKLEINNGVKTWTIFLSVVTVYIAVAVKIRNVNCILRPYGGATICNK